MLRSAFAPSDRHVLLLSTDNSSLARVEALPQSEDAFCADKNLDKSTRAVRRLLRNPIYPNSATRQCWSVVAHGDLPRGACSTAGHRRTRRVDQLERG